MSEEAEIARIAAEQRATPEDLKPAPEAPEPEPAPVEAAEGAEPAETETEEQPAEETPKPKPKKTAADYLTGRVGNLQQRLTAKEAENASMAAELEAARALLNARGTPVPDPSAQPPSAAPARSDTDPSTGRTYTPEDFQAAVREIARVNELNNQANAVYQSGTTAYPDFQETVATLNALGVMSQDFVEAAITAAGDDKATAAVLHHLSADVEEATRIASLPPLRMGVELAKLAAQVSKPAQTRVSAAPAPIPSIRGAVNPVIDLHKAAEGDTNDMSAYAAARRKQGDPFAMSRADRAAATRAGR